MLSISSRLTADGIPAFGFGGDYNPEQWDPSMWREDVALMKVAGGVPAGGTLNIPAGGVAVVREANES